MSSIVNVLYIANGTAAVGSAIEAFRPQSENSAFLVQQVVATYFILELSRGAGTQGFNGLAALGAMIGLTIPGRPLLELASDGRDGWEQVHRVTVAIKPYHKFVTRIANICFALLSAQAVTSTAPFQLCGFAHLLPVVLPLIKDRC